MTPSQTSYVTDVVTTSNNIQHHVLTFGIQRGIGAYLNIQTNINSLNANQSPYCNTVITTDTNGDKQYSLSFNLPKPAVQTFLVSGTNTIAYGNNASVVLTISSDISGNVSNSLLFNIPKGEQGIGYTYRGTFSLGTQYNVNDVVYYAKSSYVCISGNNNYYPCDDTGATFVFITPSQLSSIHVDTNYLYWKYMAHVGDKGIQGDKGDKGNDGDPHSLVGLIISGLSGIALGYMVSTLAEWANDLMQALGLSSPPPPTAEQQLQALGQLIAHMQEEIATLQGQMTTVQQEVGTLQEEMTAIQGEMTAEQAKTEYQSVGIGTYNYFPENYTRFNSSLYIGSDGIFTTAPKIHTDGCIECTKIKPAQNNLLVVDGNLKVNGNITVKGQYTQYFVSGGSFQF